MSVSIAPTDIANLALDIMRTESVGDIEMPGGDKIAAVMNRWYDDVHQALLEEYPWSFASTRASLPLNATAPAHGYPDSYKLPNDYISLNFIEDEDYPLTQYDYTIEDGNLLIDYDGAVSLDVGYVYRHTNVSKWPANFKLLLAHRLAARTVFRLTGNATIAKMVREEEKMVSPMARAIDGKSNPPKAYRQSKMLLGRQLNAG